MVATRELIVRWHQPSDIPTLVELFAECFPDEGWRASDFKRFCDPARADENVIKVLVDEADPAQPLLAAIAYTLTDDECRIRRIAVPASLRRQGWGSFILASVAGRRSPIQRRVFTAVVPETNVPALEFFRDSPVGFTFDPADRRSRADGTEAYTFRYLKAPRRRRALITG